MAGQTLEHTGPAILEEYFPEYATTVSRTYSLYSTEIYLGAALILLSMCSLGLPLTAFGYYTDDKGVGLGLVILAVVATAALFLVGLVTCMIGFRKYGREVAH